MLTATSSSGTTGTPPGGGSGGGGQGGSVPEPSSFALLGLGGIGLALGAYRRRRAGVV